MAKQKKRTGKRMGPGRPAVVVDEVRQRLFNKHFDEGYSADDIWKQNRDCISKRTAQCLVKDFQTTLLASLATCYARTQRWSTSLGAGGDQAGCGRAPCRVPGRDTARACTRYASISPPSVVICTPQNREASGTASFSSHVYASLSHHMCVRCVSKLRHHTFLPLSFSVSLRCRGGGGGGGGGANVLTMNRV
jgi:hypothetical protein